MGKTYNIPKEQQAFVKRLHDDAMQAAKEAMKAHNEFVKKDKAMDMAKDLLHAGVSHVMGISSDEKIFIDIENMSIVEVDDDNQAQIEAIVEKSIKRDLEKLNSEDMPLFKHADDPREVH